MTRMRQRQGLRAMHRPRLSRGMKGCWITDDSDPATAFDHSGNLNHGTISGAAWQAGQIGRALNFDMIDDVVTISDGASLDPTTGFSISARLRILATGNNGVLGKAADIWSDLAYTLQVWNNDEIIVSTSSDGSTPSVLNSNTQAVAGTWVSVVVTFEKPSRKIYIDGVLKNSDSWNNDIHISDAPLRIGKYAGTSDVFSGMIDDIHVWNRGLSASEVQDVFACRRLHLGI